MATIRRVYIYLVGAITLQSVAWAVIGLLRNLSLSRLNPDPAALAFQVAVILVGTPTYLIHWIIAERLARRAGEERAAGLRRFYLYAMLAGFLSSLLANAYDLIGGVIKAQGSVERLPYGLQPRDSFLYHLVAVLILGLLLFYHLRVLQGDLETHPDKGRNATIRRLYLLGFSAAGAHLVTTSLIHILRWIMIELGGVTVGRNFTPFLAVEILRLVFGAGILFVFWRWAGRLFKQGGQEEQESVLRKFYLYTAVFIGTLGVVTYSAGILNGYFKRLLELPRGFETQTLALPLPIVIVMGLIWAYHTMVLRNDAAVLTDTQSQAGVRRLYLYLVAFIGLSALVTGLSGTINVLIRSFDTSFGTDLKFQLAWATAAIIAGFPVWIFSWRRALAESAQTGNLGGHARQSRPRKIYIYFFLFIGTMTILSSLVFLVYGLILLVLGENPPSFIEVAQAISYSLIAVLLLIYHGSILREDRKVLQQEQLHKLETWKLLLVDRGDEPFVVSVAKELQTNKADLELTTLKRADMENLESQKEAELVDLINQAGLIVGSWRMVLSPSSGGDLPPRISAAIATSPGRKLLIPSQVENWDWAGVDLWNPDQLAEQTVHAIQQILQDEPVKAHRPMGIGSIVGIVIGVLFLLLTGMAGYALWAFT